MIRTLATLRKSNSRPAARYISHPHNSRADAELALDSRHRFTSPKSLGAPRVSLLLCTNREVRWSKINLIYAKNHRRRGRQSHRQKTKRMGASLIFAPSEDNLRARRDRGLRPRAGKTKGKNSRGAVVYISEETVAHICVCVRKRVYM